MRSEVLYVLVRADLPPGLQLAQVGHGCAEFAVYHPGLASDWMEGSNSIVVLSVPDEPALLDYKVQLVANDQTDYGVILVREPDLGDEATVLVVPPSESAPTLFASLPLALRDLAVT